MNAAGKVLAKAQKIGNSTVFGDRPRLSALPGRTAGKGPLVDRTSVAVRPINLCPIITQEQAGLDVELQGLDLKEVVPA